MIAKSLKVLFAALACASLCGCTVQRPLATAPSDNNETYKVNYLFDHDGVRVYRFYDDGRYVYFTRPAGTTTTIQADSTAVIHMTLEN